MWKKKGLLFEVKNHTNDKIKSHASIPFALHLADDLFRIYFSSRNVHGKSLPYYIDCKVNNGNIELTGKVIGPILELGKLGSFDDSGIMPSCLVRKNDKIFMYYIGWNPQVTVSYRLSIGLAVSNDNGITFSRYSEGPICDRSMEEPYFNTAPYVLWDDKNWKMWYISCTEWKMIDDYPEPSYHIKYAESEDGIVWKREGIVCLDYDEAAKALGRPCVYQKNNIFKMFFSYRNTEKYRTSKNAGYKIGYAESADGKSWNKLYEHTGIFLSECGWDSEMMEYCHVFEHKGIEYMIYNGNDFGKEGFGYAVR
ncbi:hypothetical protein [uncultured Chryseobacterium sp.]|uniref:hypothetical protein n=1 Tax=uncultured Chryseobacterium sp. TaxID=259322 RepID=UPI0025EB9990|nr:hypothetical protein [uncultured Chryseobacterium sp.]